MVILRCIIHKVFRGACLVNTRAFIRWLKLTVTRGLLLVRHVHKRYVEDGCRESAAALTYMTLFAMVPLLTVVYAILSALPAFQEMGTQIQSLIFENFVPTTGHELKDYLNQFSDQARKLGGVGLAFLGATAIFILKNIEKIFNKIWQTRENRSGLWSFLLYWGIISLGTLLIAAAMAVSTYLVSLKVFFDQVDTIGLSQQALKLLPYLFTSAAFTLIFVAVPNCKVPIKNGVIGGLLTALVFELAKYLFTSIVANTSYQTVYGSFAAIPLFLLWIYLSWLIVLAGAEMVHALSGFTTRENRSYNDVILALAVMELVWSQYRQGKTVSEQLLLRRPWLLGRHSIAPERWAILREKLFEAGLLRDVGLSEYILGRDLHDYSLWDLMKTLGFCPAPIRIKVASVPAWMVKSNRLLEDAQQHNRKALDISLDELFKSTTGEADTP